MTRPFTQETIMNPATQQMRETFPAEVFERVQALRAEHRLRKVAFEIVDPSRPLYLDEGARYEVFYNGRWLAVEVAAEHNIGAAGLYHGIGNEKYMRPGAWVIETILFLGKWLVGVRHYALAQVAEPDIVAVPA